MADQGDKIVESQTIATSSAARQSTTHRKRTVRPFPASSFKEACELAEAIVQISGGAREVRRITLFDHLKRSPDSGPSRQAVTNSARYGLTVGSYKAEMLKLTDDGFTAVSPEASPRERARAQFRLAIDGTSAFKALYERFSNNKLPTQQVMKDALVADEGFSDTDAKQAVELFIVNAREIGLLRTLSGAERILSSTIYSICCQRQIRFDHLRSRPTVPVQLVQQRCRRLPMPSLLWPTLTRHASTSRP
jgi:hypothetical protein